MFDAVPPNAEDVAKVVEERLRALKDNPGVQETVTVEWRSQQTSIPVISMPVDLLSYNPLTHRIRAQRSLDPVRDKELTAAPFSASAQSYLHHLLMGDPADPSKTDTTFEALKEDLEQHGQSEPGIITRAGVLINGNTRRAALKEIGAEHVRVAVLPPDAASEDLQSIELSLQLRKDHKRDYSFMNFLLAIDERVRAGRPAAEIQRDFRIRPATFERSRWILEFVGEAIERSRTDLPDGGETSMRLVEFETHQGKMEELHRAYVALKAKSPDEAEALREQRLLALALGKSKTDLRLIESDFAERYMRSALPDADGDGNHVSAPKPTRIPGTSIEAPPPSQSVLSLRQLTTQVLKARAVTVDPKVSTPESVKAASESLAKVDIVLDDALSKAGKHGRVTKRRFAPVDRLSDANEDLELCLSAIADARATGSFAPDDIDEALLMLRKNLIKMAQLIARGASTDAEGRTWLGDVARLTSPKA